MPKLSPTPPDRAQSVLGYPEPTPRRSSAGADRSRASTVGRSGGGRRASSSAARSRPAAARATAAGSRATPSANPLRRLGRRAAGAPGAPRTAGRSRRTAPAGPDATKPRVSGRGRWRPGGRGAGAVGGDRPQASGGRGRRPAPAQETAGDTVPSIDPRFRARWVAARRAEGHRRLRIVAVVGIVAVIALAGVGALHTPWLSVRHVRATPTPHVPAAEITQLSRLSSHPPMIDVDGAAIRRRLLAQPWVATATVTRQWPDTVALAVTERRPVAVVGQGAAAALVDATGRVLGPAQQLPGVPALASAPAVPPPGSWLPGTGAPGRPSGSTGVALAVAAALPPVVASQVQTVTVGAGGDVTLALANRVTTADLGPVAADAPGSAEAATIARQAGALAALAGSVDLRTVARIDLTVPDRPALTPAQAAGTVSTTARG